MVDIPLELFLGFIATTFIMIIIGIVRNPQIPALIVFAGMFILTMVVITDNIVFGSRIDNIVSTESTFNITTSTLTIPNYAYNVLTNGIAIGIDDSPNIQSEQVTANSILIGEIIQCMNIQIRTLGSPSSSLGIDVGVYDDVGSLSTKFGNTLSITDVITTFRYYEFCLPNDQSYVIQSGDRLGIGFNQTTTANNGISIATDNGNPFDGTNTLRQFFDGSVWTSSSSSDITMQLYRHEEIPNNVQVSGIGGIYSYESDTFPFDEMLKTIFALFAVILMLSGVLLTRMGDSFG